MSTLTGTLSLTLEQEASMKNAISAIIIFDMPAYKPLEKPKKRLNKTGGSNSTLNISDSSNGTVKDSQTLLQFSPEAYFDESIGGTLTSKVEANITLKINRIREEVKKEKDLTKTGLISNYTQEMSKL